jgi:spore coat protein U-like protein
MNRRASLRRYALFPALALVLVVPASAWAAQETTSLSVSATVVASVTVSTTAINFGSLQALLGATGQGSVAVSAPPGTAYTIALGPGANYLLVMSPGKRQMLGPGTGPNKLAYHLYSDAAMASIWGDGTIGPTVTGSGDGATQTRTVYGRVFSNQTANLGDYADNVVVTVTY